MQEAEPALERRVGYVLKQAQHALRLAMDDALRRLDTTAAQYAALSVLAESPGISGAELARRCFVTSQTMNAIIVGLERAGHVARQPHPVHGRILEVELTPDGRRLLRLANRAVLQIERAMLRDLTEAERAQLLDLLGSCVRSLARAPRSSATDRV